MSAVETFRQISGLIFNWILIVVGVLAGITLLVAAGAYAHNWYTYERHFLRVQFLVKVDREQCKDERYPIHVLVGNRSSRTIENVRFTFAAKRPDRNSDLARRHSFEDDHVIPPQQGYAICWSVPELTEAVDNSRGLEWSIKYKTVTFKN